MVKLIKILIKRFIFFYSRTILGKQNILNIGVNNIFSRSRIIINGNRNSLIVKNNCSFNCVKFIIRGNDNNIIIDDGVIFNKTSELWIEGDGCEIIIGRESTFESVHLAATEFNTKIIVGSDCMFSTNIELRTGDSHSVIDKISKYRLNLAQNVVIGSHVWVGSYVSILKGSEVASNSILATRAVLTKKIKQSNVMIAGIPAKIIKNNIDWKRERI
jgi:acetyltransferase-like isoleucine patch superfamily enzyme